MNTKQSGQVSLLILHNQRTNTYLGICYEFAIVLEGTDEEQLTQDLVEAAQGYVDAVNVENLSDTLFDKSDMLPAEYKQLYDEFYARMLEKKTTRKLSDEYEEAIQTGRAQLAMACV